MSAATHVRGVSYVLKRSTNKRGAKKRIGMHEKICEKSREQDEESKVNRGGTVEMQRQRETEKDRPKSGRA